ncbi:Hypothetical predicted protein [Podarcis lilfordi]|uniref:Uncharacterized protein n=1 Tax=Podarcis lilfordi TaxID=74358 RepID=A0AA35JQF7_9SAUR|nr:Hypothetical predicted protein [Podarcis lilfordi]
MNLRTYLTFNEHHSRIFSKIFASSILEALDYAEPICLRNSHIYCFVFFTEASGFCQVKLLIFQQLTRRRNPVSSGNNAKSLLWNLDCFPSVSGTRLQFQR